MGRCPWPLSTAFPAPWRQAGRGHLRGGRNAAGGAPAGGGGSCSHARWPLRLTQLEFKCWPLLSQNGPESPLPCGWSRPLEPASSSLLPAFLPAPSSRQASWTPSATPLAACLLSVCPAVCLLGLGADYSICFPWGASPHLLCRRLAGPGPRVRCSLSLPGSSSPGPRQRGGGAQGHALGVRCGSCACLRPVVVAEAAGVGTGPSPRGPWPALGSTGLPTRAHQERGQHAGAWQAGFRAHTAFTVGGPRTRDTAQASHPARQHMGTPKSCPCVTELRTPRRVTPLG